MLNFIPSFREIKSNLNPVLIASVLGVVLGGATQGLQFGNFLATTALIIVSLFSTFEKKNNVNYYGMQPLIALLLLLALMHVIYLVPLPYEFVKELPLRENLQQSFKILAIDRQSISLSVSPASTLKNLSDLLVILLFIIILITNEVSTTQILNYVLSIVVGVLIFAVVQNFVFLPNFVIYELSPPDVPSSIFANPNHLALTGLVGAVISANRIIASFGSRHTRALPIAFYVIVIIVAIWTAWETRCESVKFMLVPALFMSASLHFLKGFPPTWKLHTWTLFMVLVGLCLAYFFLRHFHAEINLGKGPTSRGTIFENTFKLGKQAFPWGTGPNSFVDVYHSVENIGPSFVNHPHNEYLKIFLELGALGILFLIGLTWMYLQAVLNFLKVDFSRKRGSRADVASAITVLTLVILFSFIDYPLSTLSFTIITILLIAYFNKSINDWTKYVP